MEDEVLIDANEALRQAGMTAEDYLRKAITILKDQEVKWTIKDAIEIAKVMALDFFTTMMCLKAQGIRDAIRSLNGRVVE